MKFTYDNKVSYILDTEVENIFISEYMVTAPGDYVKVYLYGLMCAQTGQDASIATIAKELSEEEELVRKAFLYWKERGTVKFYKKDEEDIIEFTSLRSLLFLGAKQSVDAQGKVKTSGTDLSDSRVSELYKQVEKAAGRPIGANEAIDIVSWLDDFAATPELIVKAYSYCREVHKKDDPRYVGKVVKDWSLKGLLSASAIEEYLDETERMRFLYRRVFKALGFARNATEEERRIMDVWFNEMNLPIDKVLEACKKSSGITNPNINYIDKVIKNQYKESGGVSSAEKIPAGIVIKYYDYVREKEEALAKQHTEEVYEKLGEIKALDEEIRRARMELSRILISSIENKKEAAEELRKKVDHMIAERAAILTENGFPADYMEVKRRCAVCEDTGTTPEGARCTCFEKMMEEAKEWQNSLKTKTNSL